MSDIDFDDTFETDGLEFDSGDVSNDHRSNSDHSASEVDAVADLLMGGDGSGHTPKANDSGMRSRDLDKHGNIDFSSDKSDDKSYMDAARSNQGMPDIESPSKRIAQLEQFAGSLQGQYADLEQKFANGEMSQAEFMHQRDYMQGQSAAAMIQYQQAQLEQMQNQQWMDQQVAAVREKHSDVFDDPVKRDVYAKRGIEMLGKIGYSVHELSEIGAREYNFLIDHMKMQDRLQELEVQNKMLVKEKKARQASLKRGKRDIEAGAGRSTKGGNDVYDEVARYLMGGK